MTIRTTCGVVLGWIALLAGMTANARGAADDRDFFETKVRPVLASNCYDCHTEMRSGGLRLDSREAMLKGGRSGPALVPGDPDKSLLIQAIRQTGTLKMPRHRSPVVALTFTLSVFGSRTAVRDCGDCTVLPSMMLSLVTT